MLPIVMRSMNNSRSLLLMVDGDGDGDGGSGWISAASGRGCCATSLVFDDFCGESYMGAFTEVT